MEILGLLDTLEATILDGFKIPLTKKTLVNEEQVLMLIDKIRLVIQGGSDFAKKAIDKERNIRGMSQEEPTVSNQTTETIKEAQMPMTDKAKASEIIAQAYQVAKEVRDGADKYADEVLSNLELTSTRILRTIKAGRERLGKNVQGINDNING